MAVSLEYTTHIIGNLAILILVQYEWQKSIVHMIQMHLIFFAQFMSIMIATNWVNRKMKSIIERDKFDLLPIEDSKMPLIAVRSKTVTVRSSTNPVNRVSLIEILSNQRSFDVFIKHLMAEFCIEVLLSLVEMIQFQQFVYRYYFKNEVSNFR